jgi:phosphoglucosamine mutase
LAREIHHTGKSLAVLADQIEIFPQVLHNVSGVDRTAVASNQVVLDAVAAASVELADSGRVMVRPSGTEALVRVMVEARDHETAERIASSLAAVITSELAGT